MLDAVRSLMARSLAGPALQTFSAKVLGAFLAFGGQVIIARWSGDEVYGQYVFVLAWVMLFAIPVAMGIPEAGVRFVSVYIHDRASSLLKGFIAWTARNIVAASAAIVVLLLAVSGVTDYITNVTIVILAAGLVVFRAVLMILTGLARGLRKMPLAYVPDLVLRPVLVLSFVGILFFALDKPVSPELLLASTLAAFVLVSIGQSLAVWLKLPLDVRRAVPEYRSAEWMRVAFPLLLIAGFLIVLGRTDVIMLGVFSDKATVGHYDAAYRTAGLAAFVLISVNSIAAPAIAKAFAAGDNRDLQSIARRAAVLSFWPSLVICITLALAGEWILSLFGSGFTSAVPAMQILLVGQLVNSSVGSVGNILNMTGRERISALIFCVAAVLNIVLNALAIPKYGANGAAVVTAFTMAFWNIWMFIYVRKHLGISSSFLSRPARQ